MKKLVIKAEEEDIEIARERMVSFCDERLGVCVLKESGGMIDVRRAGEFKNHAIFLPGSVDWVMGRDSKGQCCLVPLRKDVKK